MAKDKSLNMTISMNVEGSEGFDATIKYSDTSLNTVKAVQAVLLKALLSLNE